MAKKYWKQIQKNKKNSCNKSNYQKFDGLSRNRKIDIKRNEIKLVV